MSKSDPVILAIETATSVCSVAVLRGSRLLIAEAEKSSRRHNEILPGLAARALSQAEHKFSDLDLIAVSIGPGSFTGLRVGLSWVKGAAMGLRIPFLTVCTLDALAVTVRAQLPELSGDNDRNPLVLPLVTARRGEVFGRIYRVRSGSDFPDRTGEIFIDRYPALLNRISGNTWVGGEGADHVFAGKAIDSAGNIKYIPDLAASAVSVGRLCLEKYRDNPRDARSPWDVEPVYIKEFTPNPVIKPDSCCGVSPPRRDIACF